MTEQPTIEPADVRSAVIDRYSGLARIAMAGGTPVDCGPAGSGDACFAAAAYDDADVPQEALRASLGCGNPLAVAQLEPGEVVLDLGSGGGLDVLLSARRVGASGTVYGLDASPDMIRLAQGHAEQARASNVAFLQGAIEDIPLPDNHVDVIISNCVINLSGNKAAVFAESFRVLRPGGRLGISDILAEDQLTPAERAERGGPIGCIAGALTFAQYQDGLTRAGFTAITIMPTHEVAAGMHSAIVRAIRP